MTTKLKGISLTQRNKKIIVGKIPATDLINIYEVDVWESSKDKLNQGIQRPPVPAHFKKIGNQFKNNNDFSLPTSIVLSINKEKIITTNNKISPNDKLVSLYENNNDVELIIPQSIKLRVVDGQHRIKGVEYALEKGYLKNNEDFNFPFVILIVDDRYDEIRSFYEINSKAKKVPTDLALQLMNELSNDPSIAKSKLTKTEKQKILAINIVNSLNREENSVWYQLISEGTSKSDEIASSTSFVTSLLPILRSKKIENQIIKKFENDGKNYEEIGKELSKIINNFWNAVRKNMPSLFPSDVSERNKFVIQKTPGLYILHGIFAALIDEYFSNSLSENAIFEFIKNYGDEIFNDADLWKSANKENNFPGGRLSRANSGQAFSNEIKQALESISENHSVNNIITW